MIRLLIGGSPCTKWSVAQKNGRETEPSGIGWELFKNYKIALDKYNPDYFLYENNKSASQAIKDEIKKELGVVVPDLLTEDNGHRMTHIDSALVSAQHRERFYVTNFGDIGIPKDQGILLRDVLDGVSDREKARTVLSSVGRTTEREYFVKRQNTMAFEPVNPIKNGKARTVTAGYSNKGAVHILESNYSDNPNKQTWDAVAEPINTTPEGKSQTVKAQCQQTNEDNIIRYAGSSFGASGVAERVKKVGIYPQEDGQSINRQQTRVYSIEGKCPTLNANGGGWGANTGLHASPCGIYSYPIEWDKQGRPIKAISGSDGKAYRVHEVRDGKIEIKGQTYPIKLQDGFWLIRKLTVSECMRLQTIPSWYHFPVSDSQAYKMIGNGWTIRVITHLLSHIPNIANEEIEVLSMYDGMSCGQIALREMGCHVVKYTASEIDKYAIKTTLHNFPDTIQIGDAFQVREKGWKIT